ncbi:MAG: glycosyltransferase [Nanoarchaeota archaeon]
MKKNKKIIKDYFVSVIAVLDNDSDILGKFVSETVNVLKNSYENYELVLIDNGSIDKTEALISRILEKEECMRYIKLSRKYDLEVAMSAGLETVIGDIVIILEPQSDPPKLIPSFVNKTISTGGVVYGIRTNYYDKMPVYYRIGKPIFHLFCNMFFEFSPPKNAGFFMGLSRAALNAIIQIKGRAKFLRVFGSRIGFDTDKITYKVEPMRKKLRARSFAESLDYSIAVIFTNSNRYLRIVSLLGLFAAVLNLAVVVGIILIAIFKQNIIAKDLLVPFQNAVMFFFVFLIIALFIEYAIRNIDNTKESPVYYIDYEKNSTVMIRNQAERRNVFDSPKD